MTDTLKPCPFCGLPGYLEAQFGREWWVQCESGHTTGIIHSTPAEAEEEWNHRVVAHADLPKLAMCPACFAEVADSPKRADLPSGGEVNRERAALKAMEYADQKVRLLYEGHLGTPDANAAWARFYHLEYSSLVSRTPWRLNQELK